MSLAKTLWITGSGVLLWESGPKRANSLRLAFEGIGFKSDMATSMCTTCNPLRHMAVFDKATSVFGASWEAPRPFRDGIETWPYRRLSSMRHCGQSLLAGSSS